MARSRRILVSLESRATYGYSRNVMRAMRDFPELECRTLVTGMHLMPEHNDRPGANYQYTFDVVSSWHIVDRCFKLVT